LHPNHIHAYSFRFYQSLNTLILNVKGSFIRTE
jgi:hypothetical protein